MNKWIDGPAGVALDNCDVELARKVLHGEHIPDIFDLLGTKSEPMTLPGNDSNEYIEPSTNDKIIMHVPRHNNGEKIEEPSNGDAIKAPGVGSNDKMILSGKDKMTRGEIIRNAVDLDETAMSELIEAIKRNEEWAIRALPDVIKVLHDKHIMLARMIDPESEEGRLIDLHRTPKSEARKALDGDSDALTNVQTKAQKGGKKAQRIITTILDALHTATTVDDPKNYIHPSVKQGIRDDLKAIKERMRAEGENFDGDVEITADLFVSKYTQGRLYAPADVEYGQEEWKELIDDLLSEPRPFTGSETNEEILLRIIVESPDSDEVKTALVDVVKKLIDSFNDALTISENAGTVPFISHFKEKLGLLQQMLVFLENVGSINGN